MKQEEVVKWAIVVAILFAIYKLMQKVGLIKTQSEEIASGLDLQDYTSKDYWKQKSGAKLFTIATTNAMIQKLLDAHHWYNDNEEQMTSVLKSIKYKTQFSWLVDNFQKQTGEDLIAWLRNYFSEKELEVGFNWIANRPTGF